MSCQCIKTLEQAAFAFEYGPLIILTKRENDVIINLKGAHNLMGTVFTYYDILRLKMRYHSRLVVY